MSPVKVYHGGRTQTYDTGGIEVMGNITAARKHFPKLSNSQVEILYLIYRGWTWHEITRMIGMKDEELMTELLAFDTREIGVLQIREEQNAKVQERIEAGWE